MLVLAVYRCDDDDDGGVFERGEEVSFFLLLCFGLGGVFCGKKIFLERGERMPTHPKGDARKGHEKSARLGLKYIYDIYQLRSF